MNPNETFIVVLEKGFFLNEISPFGVDFEICNFLDRFMPKHTHYTLTKIQKVKKPNRTPLRTKNCLDIFETQENKKECSSTVFSSPAGVWCLELNDVNLLVMIRT